MNNINFLSKPSFPLSSDTLDFMLQMAKDLGNLTALGGQNYILNGCVVNGTSVSDGYVVVNGELLPFRGGTKTSTFIISETSRNIVALGETYNDVYIEREARFGTGSPQYNWDDLKRISDLLSLKQTIDNLTSTVEKIAPVPTGATIAFSGAIAPIGWLLCKGQTLQIADYPDLFAVIGANGGNGTTTFKLPNPSGRTLVGSGYATGLNSGDNNPTYSLFQTLGENSHKLIDSEIAEHYHYIANKNSGDSGSHELGESSYILRNREVNGNVSYRLAHTTLTPNAGRSSSVGGSQRHENRQPSIAINFIIKT